MRRGTQLAVLDSESQLIGQFWLQANDGSVGEKVTGILSLASRELEVLGEITPSIIWKKNPDGEGSVGIPNDDSGELLVHGNISGAGKPVTLVNSNTYGRTISFPEIVDAANTQHFRAEYAVEGAHLSGPSQLYSAATFGIEGLNEWAELQEVKLKFTQDRKGMSLNYQTPESETIDLGAARGTLSLEAGWTLKPPTNYLNVLETPAQFRWSASEGFAKTMGQIRAEIITPIQTLLGVLFTQKRTVTHVRVLPESFGVWCEVHAPFVQSESTTSDARAPRPLLGRAAIGQDSVAKWIRDFRKMAPFPSMLISSFTSPSALETQTLEMALAAEGLHRRLYPEARSLSVEEVTEALEFLDESATQYVGVRTAREALSNYLFEASFPQRLQRLAEDIFEIAPATTGKTNRWKHAVTDVRNSFAHASFPTEHPEDQYAGYVTLLRSLQWLIWLRVLLEAGVDASILKNSLANNEAYHHFLRTAKVSLPKIFGDA